MASEDFHLDRHYAHKKWARRHNIIAGVSIFTVIGILWAWLPLIRGYQHSRKAKAQKAKAEDAAAAA